MGAAVSPIDGKTRFLFGVSSIFGRRNQLAINGGATVAKIKVLSNSVQTVDNNIFVPAETASVPTYENLQWGFYLGVSYNLTSKKQK